ncbi:MAG: CSLREA domain-containing protein [Candidatus Angelobacter sp.]
MKHGICLRVCSIAILAVIVVFVLQTFALAAPIQSPQAQPTGPKIWLGERQQLPMQSGSAPGGAPLAGHAAVAPAGAQPLSLTTGDVDEDGIADLLVGYSGHISIQRGNLDAFAPQSDASFQAIAHGQFPAPFLAQSSTLATPVNPDFMAVGHFTGSGHNDLVIAAKGGGALYVFAGDGKGNFAAPQTVNLPGGVTAMLGGDLGRATGFTQVLVGINGHSGPELAVFSGSQDGVNPIAAFPLSGPASNLTFGDFGDGANDLAFLAGGKVQILRAQTMTLQQVSLPITASALAVGTFVIDRNPGLQLALLTADGAIHIAAHNEFDPRAYSTDELKALGQSGKVRTESNPLLPARVFPATGWKIVEDIPAAATFAPGQTPVLFRTRISDHQMDDVMVLNGSTGQLVVVQHPDVQPGATNFAPAVLSTRPYSGNPLAAIPARINVDGRAGVLSIHQGENTPSMLMPLPDPTFTVNTTNDTLSAGACAAATPGQCSLREAIIEANATAGTDTIIVPAGTYTLTIARNAADHHTSLTGTLEVQDSVNIVGAGQATTIIQGGTTLATSVDKVISFNQDIDSPGPTAPFTNATVSVSGVTIQNGNNRGDCCTLQDGFGGAFDFDTGSPGTATLTMTNVTIQNNAVSDGQGGGFTMFNTLNGTGFATLTNVIVQNNDATAISNATAVCCGDGGGGVIDARSHIVMSNVQVLTNHTHTAGAVTPTGGGLFFSGQHTQPQSHISGGSISGNTATGMGGGINNEATLLIDGGTVISNNTSGNEGASANNAGGGGIANQASDGMTLSKVTITGNSTAGDGGGVFTGGGTGIGPVVINFSRFAGNSATHNPASSNLLNVTAATGGNQVTATNNWWGTNVPSSTIVTAASTCPAPVNTNAVCFDPFIVLTHQASPEKIRINQSTTLTGDMSKDNHGNGAALVGNLNEIIGLPITFVSGPLGSIPQAQPETLNASAQATATFNAGGTSGRANPTATVDQGTALALDSLISSATEAGTTATITTVGAHGFATGETAVISGVGVGGYNGTFVITSTPTVNSFTYTAAASGLGASSGGTANVGIVILEPPSITKTFGAATIPVNGTTAVSFSINNPNVVAINTSFTDTLPAGLQVAATPGVTNTCGGTVTAVAGSGSISFSNNLTPVGICTISVNITGTVDNNYTNSVTIDSTDAGNGNTSSANLTVINPPTIAKAFGAATIPLNGATSLTFNLSSTNVNLTLNGVAFTDNLPAGLVVASTPNLSNTCGGTATAVGGSSSVSLSGASLAPGTSCTVSVNVTGTTAGVKNNSVQVTSTNAGTGNTSNASITVVGPPTIAKAFGAASIPLNGSTSLSFTITNPNTTVALTGVGFSDTLPVGLVVSTPNGLTGSCGSGTITATQATNVISLSGGTIAASTSCTFSVNVTGISAGQQTNTTGNVTSTEGGAGGTASASINVVAPPSIAKVFNPASIALNATTSLTFTITNPAANTVALTGVAFTDTLPTGLTVANASATVCGGTLTTTAPTGIALTGAIIAANSQCQFSVTVTGAASGSYTNTTGNVTSTNGGTGNTASANLTVATPPSITKAFGAASIPLNGTTSLTFTIQNPNTNLALTGIAFTDNLPAGLVVATPNALNNTCGGTATAVAGSGSISLSAGTLAASTSCTFSVNVQGTTAGVKNNSVQVTSTEAGTGNTSNASITVTGPPVITKAFGAASIPLNGSTSLSFTIQNNNTTTALSGVGFSDTLPAGLVVSTPNGLTGSCGSGTITATQATNVISLSGGTIAASTSCAFSVNVTGIAAGTQNNTTGNVTSTEGGTGGTASASINVVAPPSIAKVFNPSNIALNATTSLTFTITNPAANAVALTGVAFTDTLPTGLTVANASATVCGGTLTTTAPTGIALTGATIAANSQCQFSVTVTGAAAGSYTNTTGNVTSTNGGTGNTATANLTVATPPTITKAFGAASILVGTNTSLTFTLNNPNTSLALTGVAFSDTLPAGLQVATPNGLTTTCSGTVTAAAGSGSISLTGGSLAANASCTISLNVTGIAAGVQNNTTGPISSTESGPGATSNTASIIVIGPPSIAKAFGAASIQLNGTTTLSFTITNPNATVALTGVGFGDTLPAGLAIANPNGLTGSCGSGTITTGTVSGFSVVNLSGGTIAAGGSCTFSVNVVGTSGGHKVNTTGTVTSSNAGSGNTATASIDVFAPDLAITKTHSGTFTRGQTGAVWTITVSNVGFGPTVGTVTVVDTLPAVTNPPVPTALSGTGWTCTLATLTCTRADALASGSSYPAITLTVNIPKNIQNTFTNKAVVSGGGDVNPTNNTATDTVTLGPPIVMTPQSGSVTVVHGSTATMAINVDAPDPTLGVITFSCSGLPAASTCNFNPGSIDPAVTAGPTPMTVSIFTTRGTASLSAPPRPGTAGRNPLYAMLAFPVFGIMVAGFGGQRRKRVKLRPVMIMLGLLLLLAIVGCGVAPPAPPPTPGTPAGTSVVTITATSAGFTATTSFNLVVQ